MATLTVWKFDNPTGAGEALGKLESLQKQQLIEIHYINFNMTFYI